MLFSQLCYFELGPKKVKLSYFPPSYAIFPPSYAIFLFFPQVTLSFSPQLRYFFLFPPVKLLNSVAAKRAKDIYCKKKPPELSYFHNYAILK